MPFFLLCLPKSEVLDFVTKENFLNDLLNEPVDSLEAEGPGEKVSQKLKTTILQMGQGGLRPSGSCPKSTGIPSFSLLLAQPKRAFLKTEVSLNDTYYIKVGQRKTKWSIPQPYFQSPADNRNTLLCVCPDHI